MRLFQTRTKKRRNIDMNKKIDLVLGSGDIGSGEDFVESGGDEVNNFERRKMDHI